MGALTDRVVVITGAGNGIGRDYALRFAAEGAKVVVNSRTPSANDVVTEIEQQGGVAVAHIGSVADWSAAEAVVAAAIDRFGRVDALVNNAGVLRDGLIVNMQEADWDDVVDVHLKAQFATLHFAARHWRDRSKAGEHVHACVVNTTAGAGLHGSPGQSNYAAAKAGVAALTIVAARELQRYGVHVNAVAPLARTRLLEAVPALAEVIKKPDDPTQFDAFDPANLAPMAVHLASEACHVTGRVFNTFGGRIGVWDGWTIGERFERDQQWTPDAIAEALRHLPNDPPAFDPT